MKASQYAHQISERELQEKVVALAQTHGWLVMHSRPARRKDGSWSTPIQGTPGFPDLVLARDGTVILAELKSESGRLTSRQKEWLNALTSHGHEGCDPSHDAVVWRPSDWPDIEVILR